MNLFSTEEKKLPNRILIMNYDLLLHKCPPPHPISIAYYPAISFRIAGHQSYSHLLQSPKT